MIVYQCLAIVLLLPLLLAMGSIPFRIQQFSRFDMNNPRPQAERLKGAGARIVSAQKNAWEALLIFLTALFIATSNNVATEAFATACIIYVVARILHAVFYIANLGILRFFSFVAGISSAVYIIVQAFA